MDHRFTPWLEMPKAELDFQLSPSKSAKNAEAALSRMQTETQGALADPMLATTENVRYGPRPRQLLDAYRPNEIATGALPCLVFLHGGFWQEGDKSVSGFASRTFGQLGWATLAVGYSLTPQVTLSELTQEIYDAVGFIAANATEFGVDPAKIVVAGHSAGGHLAASLVADVFGTAGYPPLAGAVLISGVYDLAPIAASYVNDLARITSQEVERLSPLRKPPSANLPLHVLIGADEPAAFQIQSEVLCDCWSRHLSDITFERASGRDHFDILEELMDADSTTTRTILGMV